MLRQLVISFSVMFGYIVRRICKVGLAEREIDPR